MSRIGKRKYIRIGSVRLCFELRIIHVSGRYPRAQSYDRRVDGWLSFS